MSPIVNRGMNKCRLRTIPGNQTIQTKIQCQRCPQAQDLHGRRIRFDQQLIEYSLIVEFIGEQNGTGDKEHERYEPGNWGVEKDYEVRSWQF